MVLARATQVCLQGKDGEKVERNHSGLSRCLLQIPGEVCAADPFISAVDQSPLRAGVVLSSDVLGAHLREWSGLPECASVRFSSQAQDGAQHTVFLDSKPGAEVLALGIFPVCGLFRKEKPEVFIISIYAASKAGTTLSTWGLLVCLMDMRTALP